MEDQKSNSRSFLINGLGYVAGAVVGFLFIYLFGQLGPAEWLFGLVEEGQTFLQILAIPIIAWLMLALGGGITGAIGGWVLANSISTERKGKLSAGSGVAFAATTGILLIVFLLLISFIALYNNFNAERIERYGIIFGLYGLIFGLITGLVQAFTTVRLRHTWRVILASTLGFALGGVISGLIVRWVNPLNGLDTYPILTTLILIIALLLPYFIGGGALGLAYRQIARRVTESGEEVETAQSPRWQIIVVAVLALIIIVPIVNLVEQISSFLTIIPANLQSQISPVTVGVRWSEPLAVPSSSVEFNPPASRDEIAVAVGTGSGCLRRPGLSLHLHVDAAEASAPGGLACLPVVGAIAVGGHHRFFLVDAAVAHCGHFKPVRGARPDGQASKLDARVPGTDDGAVLPCLSLYRADALSAAVAA